MRTRDAWGDFVRRLPVTAPAAVPYVALEQAYEKPPRTYHTLDHALWCVTEFEGLRADTDHALEIEAALWYHDAVCDPRAQDNEPRSAVFAAGQLTAMGLPQCFLDLVCRLIIATAHRSAPTDVEEAIVQDVDLAILGRPHLEFDAYEKAIRQEYAFVSDVDFRRGRAAILRSFLDRERIFVTDMLHERYEAKARSNLQRSLASLTAP